MLSILAGKKTVQNIQQSVTQKPFRKEKSVLKEFL